jgi:predicted nucleic acid-binding Zn ribbon protein
MPKKMSRNKRSKPISRARSILRPPAAHSVKDLLARRLPLLKRVTAQAARERFWQEWLSGHIPPPLCARISAIVERDGLLTIYAESSAWSARLRYAILELEREIRAAEPALTEVKVRVLPRA